MTRTNDARAADPNQILLGTRTLDAPERNANAGDPLYVPRSLLQEAHVHVRGRTRSGKTSQAIAPLARQLLRSYPVDYVDRRGEKRRERVKDSVFVFDLGGDLALFNQVKGWAESNAPGGLQDRRTFRFVSLARDDDWDYFDPFQSIESDEVSIIQIANMLVQAFSLDHGLVYGGSYYTQQNLAALLGVTRELRDKLDEESLAKVRLLDVVKLLEKSAKFRKDAEQIRLTFDFLLEYKQLQPPDGAERVIRMDRAIRDGEVVYFFCPTMGEATTARQIAGLGLYTLINAAMERQRKLSIDDRYRPLPHIWIFVDEFQELAGRSFAALLAQASKFGVSLVMANQTTAQLQNRDLDLSHVVRDNTLLKMYFTVTGKQDIEELQSYAGEQIVRMASGNTSDGLGTNRHTEGWSERRESALLHDDIVSTSATREECFVVIDDMKGHQDPIRLRPEYGIDEADFKAIRRWPLPRRSVVTPEIKPEHNPPDQPSWRSERSTLPSQKRQETLKWLLEQKLRQEVAVEVCSQLDADYIAP